MMKSALFALLSVLPLAVFAQQEKLTPAWEENNDQIPVIETITLESDTTEESGDEPVFAIVEQMPEYPGGEQALMQYMATINYPQEARENNLTGKVYAQFVVETNGTVDNIKIIRSSGHALLDSAVVAHLGDMPLWKPGRQQGKPVRTQYWIPVSFKLADIPAEEVKKKKNRK